MRTAILVGLACTAVSAPPGQASQRTVIEGFDYSSTAAARHAWQPVGGSRPVELMEYEGGKALRLDLALAAESDRAVHHRQAALDLSRWERFALELYLERPDLLREFTLQFHSGSGLYSRATRLAGSGWHTLEFRRSAFATEGQPLGWHRITGIRLCACRGTYEQSGCCAVDNLTARREDTVIVRASRTVRKRPSEAETVQEAAGLMSRALRDGGIRAVVMGDEQVEHGQLAGRRVAIFPYNPDLSEAEATRIRKFVAAGGKVMFFGPAPSGILELLRLHQTGRSAEQYEGKLDTVHLDAHDIEDLPPRLELKPSDLTIVQPVGGQARVIGWWHDSEGDNARLPAVVISDAGAFVSHVLTGDDYEAEKNLIVGLFGQCATDLSPISARKAITGPRSVGHLPDLDTALAWLRARAAQSVDRPELGVNVEAGAAARHAALRHLEGGEYALAVSEAGQACGLLREAYLFAHLPSRDEFRACWNHSGTGAFEEGWPASMRNLHESGINVVVANFFWAGVAHYPSEYLPHSSIVAEKGDQIAQCVAAAKEYGIQVHAWKCNWRLGRTTEQFKRRLREEGRLQIDSDGNVLDWLCPSDPRNLALELDTMLEVVRKYDLDGIHLDYTRYPSRNSCFCPRCRERFQTDTGIRIQNWPEDVRREEVRDAWEQWRCDQISRLVGRTADEVHKIDPCCKMSAAVGVSSGRGLARDWAYWVERGWLDFVCPMTYTTSDANFAGKVRNQLKRANGRAPVYPGIAAAKFFKLRPDRIAGQIEIARSLGLDGFIIYNYGPKVAQDCLPKLTHSVLAEPAAVPHNGPRFHFDLGHLSALRTYGAHVAEGATVRATVTRRADVVGCHYEVVEAHVVLQDYRGKTVEKLGPAPTHHQAVTVTCSAEQGLFKLAVVGQASLGGEVSERFVSRSLPIVFGDLPEGGAAEL